MCFFFFRQKTAYEMRISDWSSDVCSSDLEQVRGAALERALARARGAGAMHVVVALAPARDELRDQFRRILAIGVEEDRKSVGEGKSVSGRLDIGGRRIIKQKSRDHLTHQSTTLELNHNLLRFKVLL